MDVSRSLAARCAVAALVLCWFASLAVAAPGELLRPGERLKIGLSGGRMAGQPMWFLRTVGDDGLLAMPNGQSISAAGRPRGEVEAQLMEQFGAAMAVVSRLDAGEDHGGGVVAPADVGPEIDLSGVRLPGAWVGRATVEDLEVVLQDVTGLHVLVDYAALELEGVERDTQISVNFAANTRLDTVLEFVLRQVGSAAFTDLTWEAVDGTLHITTLDAASRITDTRVYDVSPFDLDDITQLVRNTVRSDSWREAGGTIGAIAEIDGRLVITQTPRNHGEIVALLAKLRGPGQ